MSKFYGSIGYAVTEEIRPGVCGEKITVRNYYGDIIRNTRQYQSSDNLNDNLNVSNEFSIVADPFAYANFHSMRFIEYMGAKWKISNVEVQYPRLISLEVFIMSGRLKLHNILCTILSCPDKGLECRAYFQPPSSVKMKYPAIVYALDDIENTFANDGVYLSARKYSVTVIDSDPDSSLVSKVASMPTSRFNRHYTKDNLNHDVFEIFF